MDPDEQLRALKANVLRATASALDAQNALARFGRACQRLTDAFLMPYEVERTVALFEGRVPPSPEVFWAEYAE